MIDRLRIGIIVGSTRPNRKAAAVAAWAHAIAERRNDAQYEIVDIGAFGLPLLDEPIPPLYGRYAHDHTKAWAARIATFDGYVFVTPEYNHSTSGALKNAIDYLFAEWNDKAAGFIGYGSAGGVRAIEHLRQILGEVKVASVRVAVALSLFDDFENFATFKPRDLHSQPLKDMLEQLVAWSTALRTLR